ncbi:hypothetical protein PRIPAC_80230 [Pristionchus pacificus]|uniref:G protein-coupled receptor n=1 Tax=Pristionchus pacificus TaxID=54126 RepID=A0A2A6BE92_PRIPA|nr:hypothetical protein PRIPAC_80230 [Pristionchus pacificus]|eukprot:PDM64131.1 G protein-coupled receptor [Pristionchus pacificus]
MFSSHSDESFYRFVPIMEIGVASLSGLSMIPLFIVLYSTAVLHPNCKTILILSQLAQFGIVAMQIALVLYEYNKQVYLPDKIDGEEVYLLVHEFFYAMSTMLALFLAIERFIACLKARTYEESSRSYLGIFVALVISIPLSASWSYISHGRNAPFSLGESPGLYINDPFSHSVGHYYIGIATIFCAEVAVLVLSFVLFFYSVKVYAKETNYSVPLRERYQMNEIVQYSRAFVPSICVSSLIKIIGLIPVFIWQEGWGQYGFMRALFFTAHSINCAVMKNMLLMGHSALRRAFLKTFAVCCITPRRRNRIIFSSDDTVSKATDNHFDMLNSIWK